MCQWGLAYAAGHPFLQRTLEMILDNIKNNPYPHNVHKTTGPTVYTDAIKASFKRRSHYSASIYGTAL
ncbi:hypothetical protein [Chryseobacterium indoltheticum]|uniref:hypothetical protein n=1 Tax=Chryseobacterium indoltheticum TaxID=254 RepID=UPI003F494D15